MAKEFKKEILEHIIDLNDNPVSTKSLLRMRWGDNQATIDIRRVNKKEGEEDFIGKGISLNEEETELLCKTLIQRGYGTIEDMKKAIVKRMNRTNPDIKNLKDCITEEDSNYYIDEDGYECIEVTKYQ